VEEALLELARDLAGAVDEGAVVRAVTAAARRLRPLDEPGIHLDLVHAAVSSATRRDRGVSLQMHAASILRDLADDATEAALSLQMLASVWSGG